VKIKLIKGLFGFGVGLFLFSLTTVVNAYVIGADGIIGDDSITEEPILSTQTDKNVEVVVGEVDVPVFSVMITWTSMKFNYKYNEETYSYDWVASDSCYRLGNETEGITVEDKQNAYSLYNDDACTVEYTGSVDEIIEDEVVYEKVPGGRIVIEDTTELGSITPNVKWTPSQEYDIVRTTITAGTNMLNRTVCGATEKGITYCSISGDYNTEPVALSKEHRLDNKYYLQIHLYNATSKEDFSPNTGDTLGYITISLTDNNSNN